MDRVGEAEPAASREATSDPDAAAEAVARLLTEHPDAHVAATREDGLFVPLPAGVPLGPRHRPLTGRSALDAVLPGDAEAVIRAWESALAAGRGQATVRAKATPEQRVHILFLDARPAHGVLVTLFVPAGAGSADEAPPLAEPVTPAVRPRIGRLRADARAVILDMDEAASRMFGLSAEDVVGTRGLTLIHPDDHGVAIEGWMAMLTVPGGTQRVRLRHIRADGSYLWVEMSNQNLLTARGDGEVLTEVLDVSEEMAAQEALRASERLLRGLAEAVPVGLLQLDRDQRVVYVNDRMRSMSELRVGMVLTDRLGSVPSDDRPGVDAMIAAVFEAGEAGEMTVRRVRHGEVNHLQINARPLTDDEGTVTGAIACVTDVTESVRLRDELLHRATFDALSGCHNRASTMAALHGLLDEPGRRVGVVFLDLDRFKQVNDTHGHRVGDRVLVSAVERIRSVVRDEDVVGRLGGDEFLVVSPDTPDDAAALALAGRVHQAVSHRVVVDGAAVAITATVGSAWGEGGRSTAERLIAEADRAMYAAKSARDAARAQRRRADRGDVA